MSELTRIAISHEELETLRLCDLKGLTQEEAGQSMRISRGTVQRILTSARKKVAQALVESCAIVLSPDETEE